jgi:hypothetical protein
MVHAGDSEGFWMGDLARSVRLVGVDQEDMAPPAEGRWRGAGGGRQHGEKTDSESKEGKGDVHEVATLTLMLNVCSAKAGEAEVRRNR